MDRNIRGLLTHGKEEDSEPLKSSGWTQGTSWGQTGKLGFQPMSHSNNGNQSGKSWAVSLPLSLCRESLPDGHA